MRKTVILLVLMTLTAVGGTEEIAFESAFVVDLLGHYERTRTTADFDGDGLTDIVVSDRDAWEVTLLTNQGDGTFVESTPVTLAWQPLEITSGDLNGDQRPDVAITGDRIGGLLAVGVLLNDGVGGFAASYYGGDAEFFSAPADADGDGDLDLLVASETYQSATVFLNDGAGAFTPGASIPTGEDVSPPWLGDFDGDGLAELVMRGDESLVIRAGEGGGDFGEPVTLLDFRPTRELLADFDGDDHLDVLATYSSGHLDPTMPTPGFYLLRGRGDGTFEEVVYQNAGNCHLGEDRRFLVPADLDGDGDVDLLNNQGGIGLTILTNSGNGVFEVSTELRLNEDGDLVYPNAVHVGEWDGNPGIDIFVSNWYGDPQILVASTIPRPVITEVSPARMLEGGTRTATIRGTGFDPDATVLSFTGHGPRVLIDDVNWIDSGRIEVSLELPADGIRWPHGRLYDLVVLNPSGAAARAAQSIHVHPEFTMDLEFVKGKFWHQEDGDEREYRLKVSGRIDPVMIDALFAEAGKDISVTCGDPDGETIAGRHIEADDPRLKIRKSGRVITYRRVGGTFVLKLRRNSRNKQFSMFLRYHREIRTRGGVFVAIQIGDVTAYAEEVWPESESRPGRFKRKR